MGQFSESDHPREGDGKFASKPPAPEVANADLSQSVAMPDTTASEATLSALNEDTGRFENGYTSEDVDDFASEYADSGVEFAVVWDRFEDGDCAGDSQLIGRSRDGGPWRTVDPKVYDKLFDSTKTDDLPAGTKLLSDEPYEVQDLDERSWYGMANVPMDDDMEPDDYDPEIAQAQMVAAGYPEAGARAAAAASTDYDTAYERMILDGGR